MVRLACIFFVVMMLTSCLVNAVAEHVNDNIDEHSLIRPLLHEYWDNGLRHWSIGFDSIVTDNFVILTNNNVDSKRYLWNRISNKMNEFELWVTVQFLERGIYTTEVNLNGGLGIWYASTDKFNYQLDSSFYGFQSSFDGFGIIISHDNKAVLLLSKKETPLDISGIHSKVATQCKISELNEYPLTLRIEYVNNVITVSYIVHDSNDKMQLLNMALEQYHSSINLNRKKGEESHLDKVAREAFTYCTHVEGVNLSSNYHFGVTASNSEVMPLTHIVHQVIMKAEQIQ